MQPSPSTAIYANRILFWVAPFKAYRRPLIIPARRAGGLVKCPIIGANEKCLQRGRAIDTEDVNTEDVNGESRTKTCELNAYFEADETICTRTTVHFVSSPLEFLSFALFPSIW
jgi:hypothetical protein